MIHRLLVPALLACSTIAAAEHDVRAPRIVIVPAACVPYWSVPAEDMSPPAWDKQLSLAACAQDASIYAVTSTDELGELVGKLQEALSPSLELYADAILRAPATHKLRAAFQVGMAELALVTRARVSLRSRDGALRDALEPLLRDQAKLAWLSFSVVANAAANDPSIATDAVTRYMVRTARELARTLGTSWGFAPDQLDPPLAPPRVTGNSSSAQPGWN